MEGYSTLFPVEARETKAKEGWRVWQRALGYKFGHEGFVEFLGKASCCHF